MGLFAESRTSRLTIARYVVEYARAADGTSVAVRVVAL
jgi:hypothetical protein